MKTYLLLITLMVQGDPSENGQRSVAVTVHSRDFTSASECEANRKLVLADYKAQGYRRPSVVCLPRTGLEPELLNEQSYTTQPAPQNYAPSSKLRDILEGQAK